MPRALPIAPFTPLYIKAIISKEEMVDPTVSSGFVVSCQILLITRWWKKKEGGFLTKNGSRVADERSTTSHRVEDSVETDLEGRAW